MRGGLGNSVTPIMGPMDSELQTRPENLIPIFCQRISTEKRHFLKLQELNRDLQEIGIR
jgi:hypothetical protein